MHQNVPESFLVQRGPDELLGLQHDRLLRPAQRLLRRRPGGPPGRPGRRVQGDGGRAAPGRPGSDPRRGVQPHRRSRPGRPRAVLPRHRQPGLLPGRSRQPRRLLRHHRLRQLPQRRRPDHAAADDGLAALLADRDARRRVPVRPGARRWPARTAPSTRCRPSWTCAPRTRWCARPSWSPSRGTSARWTATTWAGSRRCGGSGTASTGTPCATSGAATRSGIGEFANRFSGSSDLYATAGRRPTASVNLITVHDGFTLRDLVSYDDKHNEANGENNRDGTSDNNSWNCGAEGPTDDPDILALRARQSRAMLTTLMLSFGVPMLLGGDEMGRTQQRQQQRLLPGQRDRPGSTGPAPTPRCWTTPSA